LFTAASTKPNFGSEFFNVANDFSIAMRLRGRLKRCGECSSRNHALQRVRCFSSDEIGVVTLAQRRENDSL
jgi:hypothetical protein